MLTLMLKRIRRPHGPGGRRRGVTLVEMLVVVALVVLMMVILVQIFQAATGAMSASRTIQELDTQLRQVDSILRSDLAGVTACMDPSAPGAPRPNDPLSKRGYFSYYENAGADAQGEDTDDALAFTTRAPEGQVFTGRQWLVSNRAELPINPSVQPTAVNSQVAEVIYFLRNGNLYRRVFLVAPERAKSIRVAKSYAQGGGFASALFGGTIPVSWLGMNDISCRPSGMTAQNLPAVIPAANDLGHLTNRENRAFSPRFGNDYFPRPNGAGNTLFGDGIPDDVNTDYLPDYWPTLYTDGVGGYGNGSAPNSFVLDRGGDPARLNSASHDIYAFPFLYPGMYSTPDTSRLALGWIHGIYHNNHSPLDVGDNLPVPIPSNNEVQAYWGFPTWRETMTGYNSATQVGWTDPVVYPALNGGSQALGLSPFPPAAIPPKNSPTFLPPVTLAENGTPVPFTTFNDGTSPGSASFVAIPAAPTRVWEDDLLMTGVRSFDVKAYDPDAAKYNVRDASGNIIFGPFSAGYYDLGYAAGNFVGGPNGTGATTQTDVPWQATGGEPVGLGHEGRIPPLPSDFRLHPRRKTRLDASGNLIPYNIGDGGSGVIRLARVWDSWSTDYTDAPDNDLAGNYYGAGSLAAYPSFPAPYPSALRGIQITIRLVDARGEKAKPLTIRHDFTDKLR